MILEYYKCNMAFSCSRIREIDNIPIYSQQKIEELKNMYHSYDLKYNLSTSYLSSSLFEYMYRQYIVEKNGILRSKNKESFGVTVEIFQYVPLM